MVIFSVVYVFAQVKPGQNGGIWAIWEEHRIKQSEGCPPVSLIQPLKRSSRLQSNVRQQIEVFFVLVGTALALAEQVLRANELDTFDPFDHFVSKLILDP